MRAYRKVWRDNNPEKVKAATERHAHKRAAWSARHYAENKERLIPYINAHRKERVKQNTPSWADKPAIRQFYVNCPKGYHVDHIIPLRHKDASGLHVLENLQYLPAKENLKKGNRCALDD